MNLHELRKELNDVSENLNQHARYLDSHAYHLEQVGSLMLSRRLGNLAEQLRADESKIIKAFDAYVDQLVVADREAQADLLSRVSESTKENQDETVED